MTEEGREGDLGQESGEERVPATNQEVARIVSAWRSQLLEGQRQLVPVAKEMSRLIANANIAALAGLQSFKPGLTRADFSGLASLGQVLKDTQALYLTNAGRALRETLERGVLAATRAAASGFLERLRESSEIRRRYEQHLWDMGWVVPPNATMEWFWLVGQLADEGDKVGVRREMVNVSRSRDIYAMARNWWGLDPFARRRRFIMDGIRDHRRGRYRVSIPTLLPHIEGIAFEEFGLPTTKDVKLRPLLIDAASAYDTLIGPALVQGVTILWDHTPFDAVTATSRQLNRHLVMHGRSTGYGTAENSAKVLFALDQLAYLVESKRRSGKAVGA